MGAIPRRTAAATGSVEFGNKPLVASTPGTQVLDVAQDAYFMSLWIRIVLDPGYSTDNNCLIGNLHYTMKM